MTPDEVGVLSGAYAIAKIQGESPVCDLKYDILKHPNFKRIADGGAPAYTAPAKHADLRPTPVYDDFPDADNETSQNDGGNL